MTTWHVSALYLNNIVFYSALFTNLFDLIYFFNNILVTQTFHPIKLSQIPQRQYPNYLIFLRKSSILFQ